MTIAQIFGFVGLMVLACSFWRIWENAKRGPFTAICVGIYEGVTLGLGGCMFAAFLFLAGAALRLALQ